MLDLHLECLQHNFFYIAAEEKRKRQQAAATNQGGGGWFSSWWSGTATAANDGDQEVSQYLYGNALVNMRIMQDNNLVITEEQKQEFYDAIEYDEDKAAAAAAIDFPKNVCKGQCVVQT